MQNFRLWSKIGLGTGRLASVGRGTSQSMIDHLLAECLDLGINVIDTADSYTSGKCESMLGSAIKKNRDQYIIVSKAGYQYGNLGTPFDLLNPLIKKLHQKFGNAQSFDARYITSCIEHSLKRLRTDRLDCFLLHDPTSDAIHDHSLIQVMENLVRRGLTECVGVSTDNPKIAETAIQYPIISVLQTPANPSTKDLFSHIWQNASERGIHIIANHIFYSGNTDLVAPPPTVTKHEFLMRKICNYFSNGTILVGSRNSSHLKQCITWANKPI